MTVPTPEMIDAAANERRRHLDVGLLTGGERGACACGEAYADGDAFRRHIEAYVLTAAVRVMQP